MENPLADLRRALQSILRAQHHMYRALMYYSRLRRPLHEPQIHQDLNALLKFTGAVQEDLTTALQFYKLTTSRKTKPTPCQTPDDDTPF